MPSPLSIIVIIAGTSEPSNSAMLAEAMAEGMRSIGNAEIKIIRLKDIEIAHFNLSCYGPSCPIDGMTNVQRLIEAADAVVIASPVWNFGVPAHLKNLIDRMGSFALDETHSIGTLSGKPFYLIFTGGMPRTAWRFLRRSMGAIPIALQYFGASILGTHFEGGCTLGRGKFGLVVDKRPESLDGMRKQGMEFANVVKLYKATGLLPLRHRLIKKIVRWMQVVKRGLGM